MPSSSVPLPVQSYALPCGGTLERVARRDGSFQWAIRRNGACLNREGDWEWEPRPSERDDAFFDRCRFDTPEEAYACWARFEALGTT